MPLPTVTVAGTINAPDGTPLTNKTVTFKTTAEMVDATGNVLVPIQTVTGKVVAGQMKAADGTTALSLYASDTGTTTVPYTIRESWSTREFTVNLLTTDQVGGHIVYSTLGPVSPAPTATSPYAELSDVEARDAATLTAAEAHSDAGDAAEATARSTAIATAVAPLATTTALTSEATTRAAADTTNANAIAAETSRAQGVEAGKADRSGPGGTVPRNQLPNISGSFWQQVANQAAMLALTAPDADTALVVFRTDTPGTVWFLNPGLNPATLGNWGSYQDDAAGAAAAAQTAAIAAAATDATTKANNAVTTAETYADRYSGSAAGTASRPLAATDATTTDARTPLGHHTTHSTGGSDPIAPADIGAATAASVTSEASTARAAEAARLLPRGVWAATTVYAVNDSVTANGVAWRCILAHTSGASFSADPTKWERFGVGQVLSSAPSSPATDDLWYDKANDLWKRWSGTAWVADGNRTYVAKDTNSGLVPDTAMSPRWKVPKAQGAVCFTFDDGYSYYDSIRQIMNANGQRGTFYISSDYIDGGGAKITSAQLLALANDGHEIGDHGKTHSNLTGVAASTLAAELDTSKTTIEAIVGAGKVNTFAYPFGATGRNTTLDLEVASRYFSARSVANFVGDGQPMFLFRSDRPGEMTPLIAAYPWGTNYPGDSDNTRSHANVLNYIRLAAKHPVIFIVLAHDPVAVGPPTDVQIQQALNLAASLGVPCLTVSEAFGNSTPILDPGFEDTTMAAWIKQGTAAETANIVTDTALTGYYGSTSLHLNVANIANNVYVSQAVPVIPGRAITFGGHAKVVGLSAGAPGLVPRLRWKNFDGTTTINSTNGTALTSANNGAAYAPISVTATPPVNCAYAQLDWLLNGVTGDAYVSHCFLQGNEAGAFG